MTTRGLGLIEHHDARNALYPLPRAAATKSGAIAFKPKAVHHRQYRYWNQNGYPRCTAYGTVTTLSAAHPYNIPPIHPDALYEKIQEFDRSQGRDFGVDGGATVTAALETARALGWISEYRWAYDLPTMQAAILKAPLIVGTDWYAEMWNRDNKGNVVFDPDEDGEWVGGHLYTLNGYEPGRGWRYPSTWDDGDYWISDPLMLRLIRQSGECAQFTEVKLPKLRKSA